MLIHGTPLTAEARFAKNALQKELVVVCWKEAGAMAEERVGPASVAAALDRRATVAETEKGDWKLRFQSGQEVTIAARAVLTR